MERSSNSPKAFIKGTRIHFSTFFLSSYKNQNIRELPVCKGDFDDDELVW